MTYECDFMLAELTLTQVEGCTSFLGMSEDCLKLLVMLSLVLSENNKEHPELWLGAHTFIIESALVQLKCQM